ncbi:hypothetical protein [uncultured Altibacter sp.]|uniref:hypothetical protein n=1 Tax=uncultured Altibacter sp. TaxID=2506933 RepID=UPI0030DCC86F
MRNVLYLLFLLPFLASAQYDFETRYFTITAESLPEIEDLTTASFSLDNAPVLSTKLKTFQMNTENYRQPVDMITAIAENENFVQRKVDTAPLLQKEFGFTVTGQGVYPADAASGVKNIAYKEVRGLDLLDPCPPVGICSRCAPYRVGRGY